jgi:hypothetical protein
MAMSWNFSISSAGRAKPFWTPKPNSNKHHPRTFADDFLKVKINLPSLRLHGCMYELGMLSFELINPKKPECITS